MRTEERVTHVPFAERWPAVKGTVMIVTYGRSGSTLLQRILQSIPGSKITGENNQALFPIYRAYKKVSGAKNGFGHLSDDPRFPWYGANDFEPEVFGERMVEVFVEQVIRPKSDTTWIGYKEIRYPEIGGEFNGFLMFCRKFFPNTHFIFNSRKASDVAKSRWWAERPKEEVVEMVRSMDLKFSAFADNNPSFCSHVQYEDLVGQPERSLKPIFEMLGEPYQAGIIRQVMAERLRH